MLVELDAVIESLSDRGKKEFAGSEQAATSHAEGLHDGRVDNAMTVTLRNGSGSIAMQTHQMTQCALLKRSCHLSPHKRSMTTCDLTARREGIG